MRKRVTATETKGKNEREGGRVPAGPGGLFQRENPSLLAVRGRGRVKGAGAEGTAGL